MARKKILWVIPFISVFVLVTGFSIVLQTQLKANTINPAVVLGANTLLFLFSLVNIYFQKKNINNPNRSAVIRGVMAGTFLKLMGLAAAALVYLVAAGPGRSVNAVFIGMGLYIVYTWLEVRISLRLKPKP